MMHDTDSVRRAAEAYLTDRHRLSPADDSTILVVRGYTAEAIEEMALPVVERPSPRRNNQIYSAAA